MVPMEMKMDLTMVRFIPSMSNKTPSTGEPVLPKVSYSEKNLLGSTLKTLKGIWSAFFGYETFQL